MDLNFAQRLAATALASIASPSTPLRLVETNEVADVGWAFVFAWNTRRWFETRDPNDAMGPSSGPIVVVKAPASAFVLASAPSFDAQLAHYAQAHGLPAPKPLGW